MDESRVLVIAAHPDDEVLGCGGTMWLHAQRGQRVDVLILAEGATARDRRRNAGRRSADTRVLRQAAKRAAARLGAVAPTFAGFPDNRMDGVELLDVVKQIELKMSACNPTIVYTHHPGDCNIDHVVTHRATLAACRRLPGSRLLALRLFEVLSSSEWGSRVGSVFAPQRYVPLPPAASSAKVEALACYASEMRAWPHPRSPEAVCHLAALRGSAAGCPAAEAFAIEYEAGL